MSGLPLCEFHCLISFLSILRSKEILVQLSQIAWYRDRRVQFPRDSQLHANGTAADHLPLATKSVIGIVQDALCAIRNNFYLWGLTAQEFFHAMAGREGRIDAALKIARTGYIHRQLAEDVMVCHDGTVHNSPGNLIQFFHGMDGGFIG